MYVRVSLFSAFSLSFSHFFVQYLKHAFFLFHLFLIMCVFFRKNENFEHAEASNQNSKSATIEMYAPSSYNDTVTGETLSSVSEKSDSYSNEGSQPDYMVSIFSTFFSFLLSIARSWSQPTDRPARKPNPMIWAIRRSIGCKNYSIILIFG